jgi:hypothetical protein
MENVLINKNKKMIKKFIFILLLIINSNSFSQDLVESFPIKLEKNTNVFQFINDSTKNITLFFENKKVIKSLLLNEKMKILDSLVVSKTKKNFDEMIGNVIYNGNHTLFWFSLNKKSVLSQRFDLENSQIFEKTFDLKFKDEVYIQSFRQKTNL